MRRWLLIGGGALAGLVLVVAVYVSLSWDKTWDDTPYPEVTASTDPEVIARGEYLVKGPAHCTNCHIPSVADFVRADAGEDVGLVGGATFEMGPLGTIHPPNLTPDKTTGIGRYTDAEVARLLRHNVKPDGRASLGPMMPFRRMADDDLLAVVSYLRTLEPVQHEVPPPQWGLLAKVMLAFGPPPPFAPVTGQEWPKTAPTGRNVARGRYLADDVANCRACHTPMDPMTMEQTGPDYAGAAVPEPTPFVEGLAFRAPNLTSHETGVLKNFPTEDAWVARFRAGRAIEGSFMHWGPFSRMTEDDLVSIYMYLNTVPPADNDVGPTVIAI